MCIRDRLYVGDVSHLVFAHHGLEHGARPLPFPGAAVEDIEAITALRHVAGEGVDLRRLRVAPLFQRPAEAVTVAAVGSCERLVKELREFDQQHRKGDDILQVVGDEMCIRDSTCTASR